jgi:non-lysosomal glucosylceramidase
MFSPIPLNQDGDPDVPDSTPFFEGRVSELMAETDAIALIQSHGYISVDTTPKNTGMSLGGIGSAITATPAGTTPSLHFIPGYFIEGTDAVPVRLTNFFFRERVLDYEKIKILDSTFFHQYLIATPLSGPDGAPYFTPGAAPDALERALARIINCPTFYRDNKANFVRWNLSISDITQKYLASREVDHKRLNWSILLDIFPNCLTGEGDYFSSLTANIDSKSVDGAKAYPADAMHYRCLYPKTETVYGSQDHKCRILKRHFSPVVAGNPKLCSLPLFRTEFRIENPTDETIDVALLQTQENIVGYEIIKSRPNEQDCVFYIQRSINSQTGEEKYLQLPENMYFSGITLGQKPQAKRSDIDGEIHAGVYGRAGDGEIDISCCGSTFTEKGLIKLSNSLRAGRIGRRALPPSFTGKEQSSGGVCVNAVLKPGGSITLNFVTILDFPCIKLANYSALKKYVEYFPYPNTRLSDILNYYLDCQKSDVRFEHRFCQSVTRHLTDTSSRLGLGLKSIDQLTRLLANSLSFIAEATVWDDRCFNVRECVDYPLFNSLDVYFYGSFGLMYLLPEADTANVKAFSECVFRESDDRRRYWMYSYLDDGEFPGEEYYGPRLTRGAVPHDMGGTFDPQPNAYNWQDSNSWKDLAPKYILLVLRNYRYTNDALALKDCWPAVQCVLEFQNSKIEPGHCLPFVNGVGDTFDNISSYGISVYCASLWVAGLRAAAEIARILQEDGYCEEYAQMADSAQRYLQDALWDESRGYYHYYSAPLSMADMDLERIGTADKVLERLKIKSAGKSGLEAIDFVMAVNR